MKLIRVCAWCGCLLDEKIKIKSYHGTKITHGICAVCAKKMLEEEEGGDDN